MNYAEINIDNQPYSTTAKRKAIIKTLLYFEIFKYPLTLSEVHKNCFEEKLSLHETQDALQELVLQNKIKLKDGFYFINESEEIIQRRKEGNELARKYLLKAKKYSKIISCFPFVEAIFISGSLAKGFADKESDIDYFIITKPGRLWLCRTLLAAFKKTFLFNSHKYFCVNYFVDSNNLEVPDKNIFTGAAELAFVKPMYNEDLCSRFFKSNEWKDSFYPNKPLPDLNEVPKINNSLFKKSTEFIFNYSLGEKLDQWCFRITIGYWKKKFAGFDEDAFDLNLRSRKNVSKHHPSGFQPRVLKAYNDAVAAYERSINFG